MRKPHPWYRKSKNAWFVEVTIAGETKQRRLGVHPEGAPAPKKSEKTGRWNPPEEILRAFHKLLASDPASIPPSSEITVAKICSLFLESVCPYVEAPERPKVRKEKGIPCPVLKENAQYTEKTYWWYRDFVGDFGKTYFKLAAKDLRPIHVTRWLDAHPGWKSSRRAAITAVKRAFSWADREGVLSPNPIKGVKRPAAASRARTLTAEERREILDAIPDRQFRDFVEAMQETGARPSEISRLEGRDVNLELGICVLHRHKGGKRTGKPRVIYMTERMKQIVMPLMALYKQGALFRGPRLGRPFGRQGICSRFRRLRKKLPHLKDAIAYAYRHSFATDALVKGVPMAQVAELLGHRSTEMVARHYGHLADQVAHMRQAAEKATGGQ